MIHRSKIWTGMDKIVENSDQILRCFIYHSSGPDGRAFALHADYQGSTFGCDRPKSLEQAVTVPIPNTWQQM